MIVLDHAGIHPYEGTSPPFATLHCAGDVEDLVFADRHKSVYIAVPAQNETEGKVAHLAVRILLDNDILRVPPTDPDTKNLKTYFDVLPRRATLYAMRDGRHVNYDHEGLRRDWNRLFAKNAMYRALAAKRYKSARQALQEFHSCTVNGNRFFQKLTQALYGRITAHTEECAARVLLGAAVVKQFPRLYKSAVPLISM